jgi:thiosulfate/3-mercaptopyruvate sulfurtransferase
VFWPAQTTLVGPDYRTNFDVSGASDLLGRSGISNDSTVVAYSERHSLGPWVFWYLKTMGHADVRVLDGGRSRWLAEGRPLTTVVPDVAPVGYVAQTPERSRQADLERVLAAVDDDEVLLLDVRTAEEWRGENFMLGPPQDGERGGHIPGAVHVYYEEALNPDGTFKSIEDLAALFAAHGVTADRAIITYCAVGMRSAHTWFVLSQLRFRSRPRRPCTCRVRRSAALRAVAGREWLPGRRSVRAGEHPHGRGPASRSAPLTPGADRCCVAVKKGGGRQRTPEAVAGLVRRGPSEVVLGCHQPASWAGPTT